jgi:hypothetical protein
VVDNEKGRDARRCARKLFATVPLRAKSCGPSGGRRRECRKITEAGYLVVMNSTAIARLGSCKPAEARAAFHDD